jgi:hypothetical protein
MRFQVEKRKQEEKMKRDQLNDAVLELAEQRRRYYKAVKDFQEVGNLAVVELCACSCKHSVPSGAIRLKLKQDDCPGLVSMNHGYQTSGL